MRVRNYLSGLLFTVFLGTGLVLGQASAEHEDNIYGVKIGMDVPTALEAVFVNAKRKPGQEKPDSKRNEGKDGKDIRVAYKLDKGELFILFAQGKVVREVQFKYAKYIQVSDLLLPPNGSMGNVMGGQRFDDRYTIGFSNEKQEERIWWREEKRPEGYRIRLSFISRRLKTQAERDVSVPDIERKIIAVKKEDEVAFNQAMGL